MRRTIERLLCVLLSMVQDDSVLFSVTMKSGRTHTVEAEGEVQDVLDQIENRTGDYSNGWLRDTKGNRLNIDCIQEMGPRPKSRGVTRAEAQKKRPGN
jgi:hypothetical protein